MRLRTQTQIRKLQKLQKLQKLLKLRKIRKNIVGGLLMTLILVVLASGSVNAQDNEPPSDPLILEWQGEYSADAALITPSDIVVDSDGFVYVSTQGTLHIKKFDPDGNFVHQWGSGGNAPGEINLSAGIAADAENNIYVADFNNIRIQKFDSEGNFLLEWPTEPPRGPASVVVDAEGYVYVDNFTRHDHHLQKFDSEGNVVHQWGETGTEPGQIAAGGTTGPEDIALDPDGNIYVADRLNARIQKFAPDGTLLQIFGGEPSKDGYGLFYYPLGVAIDADGNIYVADIGSQLIQKLDAEGNFIAQWSTDGGELDEAAIIALDAEANIYVFAKADVVAENGNTVNVYVLKKFRQPS